MELAVVYLYHTAPNGTDIPSNLETFVLEDGIEAWRRPTTETRSKVEKLRDIITSGTCPVVFVTCDSVKTTMFDLISAFELDVPTERPSRFFMTNWANGSPLYPIFSPVCFVDKKFDHTLHLSVNITTRPVDYSMFREFKKSIRTSRTYGLHFFELSTAHPSAKRFFCSALVYLRDYMQGYERKADDGALVVKHHGPEAYNMHLEAVDFIARNFLVFNYGTDPAEQAVLTHRQLIFIDHLFRTMLFKLVGRIMSQVLFDGKPVFQTFSSTVQGDYVFENKSFTLNTDIIESLIIEVETNPDAVFLPEKPTIKPDIAMSVVENGMVDAQEFALKYHLHSPIDLGYWGSECVDKIGDLFTFHYRMICGSTRKDTPANAFARTGRMDIAEKHEANLFPVRVAMCFMLRKMAALKRRGRFFDPSSGWNNRSLAAMLVGALYYGTDPSPFMHSANKLMIERLVSGSFGDVISKERIKAIYQKAGFSDDSYREPTLANVGVMKDTAESHAGKMTYGPVPGPQENSFGYYDATFTSPPYGMVETYSEACTAPLYAGKDRWIMGFGVVFVSLCIGAVAMNPEGTVHLHIHDFRDESGVCEFVKWVQAIMDVFDWKPVHSENITYHYRRIGAASTDRHIYAYARKDNFDPERHLTVMNSLGETKHERRHEHPVAVRCKDRFMEMHRGQHTKAKRRG